MTTLKKKILLHCLHRLVSLAYRNRKERTTFDTFVLEVHVISDQAHNKHFGENEDLISYLAIMANAVSMLFQTVRLCA